MYFKLINFLWCLLSYNAVSFQHQKGNGNYEKVTEMNKLCVLGEKQWIFFWVDLYLMKKNKPKVCFGLRKSAGMFIRGSFYPHQQKQPKPQTAPAHIRSSPACERSTSCTASRSDRWPGPLGSSMARGWIRPEARGSVDSSGNHGDSAGSRSCGHPSTDPARFQHPSERGHRVTITHMTNASPPEARAGQRQRRRSGWREWMRLLWF